MSYQRSQRGSFDIESHDERSSTMQSGATNIQSVYKKMITRQNWNKTVLLICVVALGIDPLFLFIPVIDAHRFCFTFDKKLAVAVCVFRTFIDTFYVIHIIFDYLIEPVTLHSQVSLRDELIKHSEAIGKMLFVFHFIVDIFSVFPIPQVAVLTFIQHSDSLVTKRTLKWIILSQYIPRIIRIYPHFKEVTKASGTVAETKWIGAAINLFLYMLHSCVFGAFWYVSAVEKENKCWRAVCAKTSGCHLADLYCGRGDQNNGRFLNTSCPLIDPDEITNSSVFNFGMYIDALKSGIVEKEPQDFPRKFFYCFWWGLRNLRFVVLCHISNLCCDILISLLNPLFNDYNALGQNLKTSNSVGDIIFALIICLSGLLLFAVLIGNVQKYLQSTTIRMDEMEEKKRDTEKWMSSRRLPESLKERIVRHEYSKWRELRGIEEESLLRNLPKDLRLEAKRHLYLDMLKRIPWLETIDDWLLEAVCDRVKSVSYSANSYIVREGEPVEEMLIVTKGELKSTTRSHGIVGDCYLRAGDICGQLLFYSSRRPTSNRTVTTVTKVAGFILLPDDVKFVVSHLNSFQSKKLKRKFRSYFEDWRYWAACFIQASWREHYKRKLSKIIDDQQIPQGTQLILGTTLYASRFVSKALQNRRQDTSNFSSSPVPRKPADPEFSKDEI